MDLFDFINTMFKPDEYRKLKSHEKAKHFYMVNQFMSISFPVQANAFNHTKMLPSEAVDYWQEQMSKLYKKTPAWMYTSTKKGKKKEKIKWPSEESIKIYLSKIQISRKDLDEAVKMFGIDVLEPIFRLEKSLNEIYK